MSTVLELFQNHTKNKLSLRAEPSHLSSFFFFHVFADDLGERYHTHYTLYVRDALSTVDIEVAFFGPNFFGTTCSIAEDST